MLTDHQRYIQTDSRTTLRSSSALCTRGCI